MSFREFELPEPSPSPDDRPDNSRAVLDAYDTLILARSSEVYLQALEHFICMSLGNDWAIREQLLSFLKLYRVETEKGLDKTAEILKTALEQNWETQQ